MSDPRDMPCLSHAPDFDHYCALKGQGCTYHVEEKASAEVRKNEWRL